jgi:hypothetical protein
LDVMIIGIAQIHSYQSGRPCHNITAPFCKVICGRLLSDGGESITCIYRTARMRSICRIPQLALNSLSLRLPRQAGRSSRSDRNHSPWLSRPGLPRDC